MVRVPIEIGDRFGKLVILAVIGRSGNGQFIYRLECDCGEFVETTAGVLRGGRMVCCGLCGENPVMRPSEYTPSLKQIEHMKRKIRRETMGEYYEPDEE